MFTLSGICEAVAMMNLTMIQHFKSRIDTKFIIDNLLSSEEYRILCDNLYSNWTSQQILCFTKDFTGDAETYSCEVGFASYTFLQHKKFTLQVQNLLPDNQKEQLSYLIDNKIVINYVQELFHELA
jgi:hypothetical protein